MLFRNKDRTKNIGTLQAIFERQVQRCEYQDEKKVWCPIVICPSICIVPVFRNLEKSKFYISFTIHTNYIGTFYRHKI